MTSDSSPDMLAHARQRVPEAEFHVAELDRLPLPDDSVDVIVCALALDHVAVLDPVIAEFARVLRPGGDLVISDVHHELITRGSAMTARGPAGEPRIAPSYRHHLGDYLRPALRHGLRVRRCEEPRAVRRLTDFAVGRFGGPPPAVPLSRPPARAWQVPDQRGQRSSQAPSSSGRARDQTVTMQVVSQIVSDSRHCPWHVTR